MPKTFDEIKDIRLNEVELTLEELQRNVDASTQLLAQITAIHKKYARKYLSKDRPVAHAQGLVHSEEEAEALDATLTAAEEYPHLLKSLAKTDGGSDDDAFEVPLIYARLEAVKRLQAIGQKTVNLGQTLLDTAATIGQNAKPTTQAAYRILKLVSTTDTKLETALAPAITFHKSKAKKGSRKATAALQQNQLKILEARFKEVSPSIRAAIKGANIEQLEAWTVPVSLQSLAEIEALVLPPSKK